MAAFLRKTKIINAYLCMLMYNKFEDINHVEFRQNILHDCLIIYSIIFLFLYYLF